ncbi:MAG: hypothetical protein IKU10_02745 [Clostridia bacterium]|nr:hypothetical protein [Clostridia bacterium]
MIAWGVLGLLHELGILPKFPLQIAKFESKQLAEYIILGMAALQVLLFIFLIIFTASNGYESFGGEAGIRLSVGIFIALATYIGSVVALKRLKKKFSTAPQTESQQSLHFGFNSAS